MFMLKKKNITYTLIYYNNQCNVVWVEYKHFKIKRVNILMLLFVIIYFSFHFKCNNKGLNIF